MKVSPARRPGPKPKPDTRNKLVKAGVQMIHADGFSATGIQSIVDRARVPKGSFYNHFTSKEAFAAEVIEAYFDRGRDKLREILCNNDAPPLERLEAYFDDRIEALRASGFVKGCLLGNFSAEVADHSEVVRERLDEQFNRWSGYFEDCIAQAQEQGTLGDQFPAALLGRFVLNSWEGALLRMKSEKSDAPLVEFKEIVFGKLLADCRT